MKANKLKKKKILSVEEARRVWESDERKSVIEPLRFEVNADEENILVKIIVHSLDGAVSVCCFWPSYGLSDVLPIRAARVEPVFGISTDELLASIELKAATANIKEGALRAIASMRRTNQAFHTINVERMKQMNVPSIRMGLCVKGTYALVKIEKLRQDLRIALTVVLPVEGLRTRAVLKQKKVEKYFGTDVLTVINAMMERGRRSGRLKASSRRIVSKLFKL